jgi:hypothetical protein
MKTITENEFFDKFMKISQDLTYSEVRMLYLIITEPSIIDIPQELFAKRIQTHRRTINIGLKKLRKLNYISEVSSPEESEVVNNVLGKDDNAILLHEKVNAKKVVINSFNDYSPINKKNFIVNEDYFHFTIGDIRLPLKFRHDKTFVIDTIKEIYPEIRFYFELKESAYTNVNHYYINRMVNSEIKKATNDRFYGIKTEPLLRKISENFSIEMDEALKIIKTEFPKIRITEKRIYMRRSYKGKGSF